MRMTHRIWLCAFLVAACSRDKVDPVAVAALGEGVAAIPAEARVVVGINFAKVAGSTVGAQALDWALAADPRQKELLLALLAQCKIDPAKDLDTALIAMGEGAEQVSMLVRGKLSEGPIVACVREAVVAKGGTVEVHKLHDRAVWAAVDPQSGTRTWFTIENGRGALIATSQEWLGRALDPASAKLPSRPELNALIARVDPTSPLWAAALMRPETGARLPELTKGAVKEPAASFTIETKLDFGVDL